MLRRGRPSALALLGGAALLIAATPGTGPGDSPVADAAMRRDTAQVRALLTAGADVNAAQGDGMTALHWAARNGDAREAQMLLYAGARIGAVTRDGNYTPLHLATQAGHPAVVKALIEAGADVNAVTTSGGAAPLHFAAGVGDTASILALLAHGAKVDVREGAWSQTPLMWAADYNRVSAIRVLVSHGADLKATSKVENIPEREKADRAQAQLRSRRVAALKAAEAPPASSGPGGAAGSGRRGASGGRSGRAGGRGAAADTAAAYAGRGAGRGNRGRGRGGPSYSDLIGNKGGLTPLLFAVREGNAGSVNTLLDLGADVNEVSAGDHTSPLLMATINGQLDLAEVLLEHGADPKLASDAGATPLYATINVQWAPKSLYPQPTAQLQQKTNYLVLMEDLIKAGADVNARLKEHLWYMSFNFDLLGVNTTGATPFWRAAYGLDVPAMKLLVKYGADPTVATIKPEGRMRGADAPVEEDSVAGDPSGLPPVPKGGPGVFPIHAASGVGYGEGYAANAHRHAPDAWLPAVKYLVEELHADVNARDYNGYTPLHDAAARGDNELIMYLVSKGADVTAVSRKGQTTADMANGPVQRIPPFVDTVALLEKLGSKNNHKCKSC